MLGQSSKKSHWDLLGSNWGPLGPIGVWNGDPCTSLLYIINNSVLSQLTTGCVTCHTYHVSIVGRIMVLYVNCLQRLNWQPEHAFTIILSAMNLTCKNQGFYYNSGGRIKSWNFRSAPNVIIHILKSPVNSYDSNGVIAVPISTLGDKKWNLLFFCLPILPRNPLNVLGHIIRRWKDIFKEKTTPLESWETVQNWWRNSGNQLYEFEP